LTAPARPRAAGPFSAATVLWMVVVGGLSGLLFLVLIAYAPDLRRPSDGGTHALSKSAVGFAGLAELLRAEGTEVKFSRSLHPDREGRPSLLVLTPGLGSDPKAMVALRRNGAELVVLPKWEAIPDQDHPGWVASPGLIPAELIASRLLNGLDKTDYILRRQGVFKPVLKAKTQFPAPDWTVEAGAIDTLQTIAGPDKGWVSVVEDQNGETLVARKANAAIYILSDPDLLDNHGLAQLANARAATGLVDVLRSSDEAVTFDLTLAGFARTRSVLKLAFEPPFLAATLCALAAAGLMGLHAATRFGPPFAPAPAFAFGKRALADNSAALMRLVRREYRMGAGYAALTRSLAARAVGAPRDLGEDQLDALLDRLGRARHTSDAFTRLASEARLARDTASLMAATRRLFQWRREMTGERR
jgi:hypothetical protein